MAEPFEKQLAQLGSFAAFGFDAVRMLFEIKQKEVHLHRTKFVLRDFGRNSFGFRLGACVYCFHNLLY